MTYTTQTLIEKGWSSDKKYRVTAEDGTAYLLRVSEAALAERKRAEFELMGRIAALGVPMCRPVEFGMCDGGVYSLQTWIDGEDAEAVIPTLPPERQYAYGLDSGRILARIHTIPAPPDAEPWAARFGRKLDRKLENYAACPLKYPQGEAFITHIRRSRHLLSDRPQVFQHGDYHIGNFMLDRAGVLTVIDFNRSDFGDPWEEFNRIVWCAQASPAFASGMVDGYFGVPDGGTVPDDFWALLALYIASNTLSSLPWAIPFGDGEIATMMRQAEEVLAWYGGMERVVPGWYPYSKQGKQSKQA